MREIKDLDVKAFEWLADKHPSEWSRSHFNTTAHSDMLVNNICESFNSMILEARENPLINCLEILRKQVMVRLYECKVKGSRWCGPICPNIVDKINVIEKQAGAFWCYQSSETLFEVIGAVDHHQVDLGRHLCSCRKWDLTGIPCRHAVSTIWVKYGKGPVYDYVHPCYSVQWYNKAYEGCIHPMAGIDEWPVTNREPPLPLLQKTKLGRPNKLRKRSAREFTNEKGSKKKKRGKEQVSVKLSKDGVHVSRQFVRLHCTICKQTGHNSRTCSLNITVRENNQRRRTIQEPGVQENTTIGETSEIPSHAQPGVEDLAVVEHSETPILDDPLLDTWDAIELPFDLLEEECHVFDITQTTPVDVDNTQSAVTVYTQNTHALVAEIYENTQPAVIENDENTEVAVAEIYENTQTAMAMHSGGVHVTHHGVKLSYGPPPRAKNNLRKGKLQMPEISNAVPEVDTIAEIEKRNPKKKSLGLTSARSQVRKKHMTRSLFKTKWYGNSNEPIELE